MDFLSQEFYGNTVKTWLISLGIILGSVLLAKLTYWILGKTIKQITARTKSKLDDILVDKLQEPGMMAIIIIGSWYAINLLKLKPGVSLFFHNAYILAMAINITWFVSRTVDTIVGQYLSPYVQKNETRLDDALMPIFRRGIKIIIWIIGIIMGLNNAGFDVAALIAGLGIGGLALALASQDTVKNIISGLMIILDKPFKIGDKISVDKNYEGIVEDIGVRSTRLRLGDGRQVTMPNMLFADKPIINISREPAQKVVTTIRLAVDTPPDQMKLALQSIEEITNGQAQLVPGSTQAIFSGFALGHHEISLTYLIETGNNAGKVQNEINNKILEVFTRHQIAFAPPAQK